MKDPVLLRIRFPYEDGTTSIVDRIKKFETLYYNIFHLTVKGEDAVALEVVVIQGSMNFYVAAPRASISSIASFFFGEFPDAELNEVPEYQDIEHIPNMARGFFPQLIGSEAFTLRTAHKMNGDPLNAFFNALSELPQADAVLYQIIVDPIDEMLQQSGSGGIYGLDEKAELAEVKPKFSTCIRIIYFAANSRELKNSNTYFENVFSPFATERNHLKVKVVTDAQGFVDAYFNRIIQESGIFTTEEIASLFHSPDPLAKIRGVDWLFSRKAEAPMGLPTPGNTDPSQLSVFGVTNFRGKEVRFGIHRDDRRRHLYIAGKSGVGKSKLLEKLISDDIKAHKGLCVIDPHGDLVQAMLYHVPESRIKDVVYFNPSDLDCPIAFNPLENVSREFRQQVTQGLIEIFKKFFGADWTPKIEHVFRFTVLALLDFKNATLMGMQKMLTDRAYRQMVIAEIQDHVVKKFWANEFSSWSEKFDNEAIVPLINKLGQFLSNEMVRNIVAQPKNKVNFNDIMNNERILLVELSKGKLGEENSALLGSLIITKIEQEGMARAFITQSERKDFYLYVDEFQNFATKTFDNILSEARKYRLDLTVSHQYLGQLLPATRETIFGNVGSIITFRLGADDAKYIAQELAPRFSGSDIMNLGVREMYLKISIQGAVTPAFSARTADVPEPDFANDLRERIIEASRKKYATPIREVEQQINDLYESTVTNKKGAEGEKGGAATAQAGQAGDEEQEFEAPLV